MTGLPVVAQAHGTTWLSVNHCYLSEVRQSSLCTFACGAPAKGSVEALCTSCWIGSCGGVRSKD
jgi:hypothetical protein